MNGKIQVKIDPTDTDLIQREHVEVTDIIFLCVFNSGATLLFIDNLSHIFTHKGSLNKSFMAERQKLLDAEDAEI